VKRLDTVKAVIDANATVPLLALPGAGPAGASRQKGAPWSAEQATGAPDTESRGDFPSAWAPRTFNHGKEWLRVEFDEPADLEEVRVHNSNEPGAIISIAGVLKNGMEVPLQISPPVADGADHPHIVSAKCAEGALLNVRTILITLDTTLTPHGWPEIDAVELIGRNGTHQWASRATASSSYAEVLGAAPSANQPFERAKTLEEANERLDILNERLRALEERLQALDAGKAGRSIRP
jgi:hypothetical protein